MSLPRVVPPAPRSARPPALLKTLPTALLEALPPALPWVLLAAFVLGLLACASERPPGPAFTTRDSAGIVIAENAGEPLVDGGGWALSAEPLLQIGSMEGDDAYLFFRIWGATRLSDGRLAVANNRAPDLRIFDAQGRHLHTFGQRGEGPEDFNSPVLMGTLPGDTLVVVDRILRRINLYDPDEGFIRGSTADTGIEGYLLTVGMFSSGSVMVRRQVWTEDLPNGYFRFPVQFLSVALDGSLEHDFGEFPGDETLFSAREVEGGVMTLSGGSPFGKSPAVAVTGDRFFYGSQDSYEVQVWNQDGTLTRIIRRDETPEPVSQDHVAALMEEMAEGADDSDQLREFRRMYRDASIPEYHPAYGFIYADTDGFLWVEEYRLPGDEVRRTTIFDPEGRMVGSLVIPNRFQIYEIGRDYVLGRWVDELGVEYLRLYGLTRPA